MKAIARIAGHLIDVDDLALIGKGAILLLLGVLALFVVAVAVGLALQLFEATRGIG